MPTPPYEQKKARLLEQLQAAAEAGQGVALRKTTSNLFRHRQQNGVARIDVRDFNEVIRIDPENRVADVEGMITFEDLVDATLEHGLLPPVVPELKSITLGGATTGLGIESSSFKYGLVHETVQEMEILLGDGTTVVCTPENEHRELFFGFPNSYGTLGYALRLRIPLIPAPPYVRLEHRTFDNTGSFLRDLEQQCREGRESGTWDFIDATVFGPSRMVLTLAKMVDKAPWTSNYKHLNIYYKSLLSRHEDFLTTRDYIWRWDTDWFWCSKHFGVQNPVLRPLVAWAGLRSTWYWKLMRFNHRYLEPLKQRMRKVEPESVIQDVQTPIEHAAEFLDFFHRDIGITPVWICPTQCYEPSHTNTLYPMEPDKLYLNFGFWDVIRPDQPVEEGHYNRLIEEKLRQLDGKKSLYSNAFYSEDEFWELYNKPAYEELKARYDAGGRFKDLYDKCVRSR